MSEGKSRGVKGDTLTIRLTPKTRFLLEFVARHRGQTITTLLERAVVELAERTTFRRPDDNESRTWQDYWDISEGVRTLKIAEEPNLYPTYEEEQKLEFAKTHWPFFYASPECTSFMRPYITILWPRIEEYINVWNETQWTDYFAAGRAMHSAISSAKVNPPDWPPKKPPADLGRSSPKERSPSAPSGRSGSDLDDDIPF